MKKLLLILTIGFIGSANTTFGQERKLSGITDILVSGNGHGSYVFFGLSYQSGFKSIEFGPMMQMQYKAVNGFRLRVNRILSDAASITEMENSRFYASLFAGAHFYKNARLSAAVLALEQELPVSDYGVATEPVFNTLQVNTGLAGTFKVARSLSLRTFLVVGIYSHLNQKVIMYHEKAAPILTVGAGIQFK